MATQPAYFRTTGSVPHENRPERDAYQLRPLPHEDVFFYSKRIDNSRLVREPDPRARGACWSAVGAAAVVLALLTSVFAPSVASTLAGYKLEALRAEQRRLLNDRRVLQLQEAELLRPDRLEALAKGHNLVTPKDGQTVHLDGKSDGKVAMVK
jgi:cell division protein FtsL